MNNETVSTEISPVGASTKTALDLALESLGSEWSKLQNSGEAEIVGGRHWDFKALPMIVGRISCLTSYKADGVGKNPTKFGPVLTVSTKVGAFSVNLLRGGFYSVRQGLLDGLEKNEKGVMAECPTWNDGPSPLALKPGMVDRMVAIKFDGMEKPSAGEAFPTFLCLLSKGDTNAEMWERLADSFARTVQQVDAVAASVKQDPIPF